MFPVPAHSLSPPVTLPTMLSSLLSDTKGSSRGSRNTNNNSNNSNNNGNSKVGSRSLRSFFVECLFVYSTSWKYLGDFQCTSSRLLLPLRMRSPAP
jgi:hypothetical protein